MSDDRSFEADVEYLSRPLRRDFGLSLEVLPDGDVVLRNDVVRLRLFPGWPRDPYVSMTVSYADPEILGKPKYFELWRYIAYRDAWPYFPVTWPEGPSTVSTDRDRRYSYIASPILLLEIFVFLATQAAPVLLADREHVQAFMAWVVEQDRLYNLRVGNRTPRDSGSEETPGES